MKAILISISLFISLGAACQTLNKKEIKLFCNDFSTLIVAGDMENAFAFLDKDYVKTQHDDMLKGKTDQFFEELLGGTDKKNSFMTSPIKNIKSMKTSKILYSKENGYDIKFSIVLNDGVKITSVLHLLVLENGKMALVGAVG